MATNKKRFHGRIQVRLKMFPLLLAIIWLAGCSPTGPGALLRGKRSLEKGDYADAVAQLERAASLLSTNAQAWNYLGVACQKAGQTANAQESYQHALKLNPDLFLAHYNFGCLLLEENRPDTLEGAQNEFTAYVLRQPGSADGWLKLGIAQLRVARLPAADASFREVLKLVPQNVEALNDLGLVQLQRRHYHDASIFFNLALRQQTNYAPAILNLAVTDIYQNNRAQALEYYQEYLGLNPRPANWDTVQAAAQQLERELSPQTAPVPNAEGRSPTQTLTNNRNAFAVTEPARSDASNTAVRNGTIKTPPSSLDLGGKTDATRLAEISKPAMGSNNSTPQPISPASSQIARKGFLQKINPLNLFDHTAKPESHPVTPLPVVTLPENQDDAVTTPVPKPRPAPIVVARYPYMGGGKPADGRRDDAERFLFQGQTAQRDHRLKDAVAFYRSATQTDPGYFDAQLALGAAGFEAGDAPDLSQSLRGYEMAVAIEPDSFTARYGFGLALKKATYIRDAAEQLELLLAAHATGKTPSQLAAAHLTLGNLYADQFHQNADARAHYQKVLELDPENSQATAIRYWLQNNSN